MTRSIGALVCLAVVWSACHQVLPYELQQQGADGRIGEALPPQPEAGTDGAVVDGPAADLPVARHDDPCPPTVDSHTVALYTMDDSHPAVVQNSVPGGIDGEVFGSLVKREPSNGPCGSEHPALTFPLDPPLLPNCEPCEGPEFGSTCPVVPSHAQLPGELGAELAEGSVDFWLRLLELPAAPRAMGILSRDAYGSDQSGHLTILLYDGWLMVRLQSTDAAQTQARCSAPLEARVWYHVGVNFGPGGLALFVNAQAAMVTGTETNDAWRCNDVNAGVGIDGNTEPWVIGGNTAASCEGEAEPMIDMLAGAKVTNLRVSSIRRDFGSLDLFN